MRRKDREVTDQDEIFDILKRCQTLRLSMNNGQYPYTVPVSFAAEKIDGKVVIYFHGAKEGTKVDLLRSNPNVCVEGDIFHQAVAVSHSYTVRYESVIGFGQSELINDKTETLHALKLIMDHYGFHDDLDENNPGLNYLLAGKIVLEQLTGKRNLG
ncbi:5-NITROIMIDAZOLE ANTIBIOTIC RESISTANCE PROTEIN [Lactobacillus equicursoris 66c]|uniref:5-NITROIMIDAZOLE ANTIBIOTIC RESISTANCE PROTEIN n=1 Tax=Lactobacillus equicursoris 66c TaxID=872326 RepID=K0NRE6_9LACO|nr:pyridoxamine 5'-phosphate oxidase family protein [Lactobacillus equicursoris]CCK84604.1 5-NITROIMIDAZOLE ANTIBIOTIC RESISTANCE PROTEIN [Lactobacillus equicursoris 66c]